MGKEDWGFPRSPVSGSGSVRDSWHTALSPVYESLGGSPVPRVVGECSTLYCLLPYLEPACFHCVYLCPSVWHLHAQSLGSESGGLEIRPSYSAPQLHSPSRFPNSEIHQNLEKSETEEQCSDVKHINLLSGLVGSVRDSWHTARSPLEVPWREGFRAFPLSYFYRGPRRRRHSPTIFAMGTMRRNMTMPIIELSFGAIVKEQAVKSTPNSKQPLCQFENIGKL
jgi:hypothetical protein